MEIFVGNIGTQTSSGQIKRFFGPYAQKATKWQCSIMRARNAQQDRTVYFAHVLLEPEHVALSAIKHLNQQKCNGKTFQVREYVQRSGYNRTRKANCPKPGLVGWLTTLIQGNSKPKTPWNGQNRRCMNELEDAEVQSFLRGR